MTKYNQKDQSVFICLAGPEFKILTRHANFFSLVNPDQMKMQH